MLQDKDNETFEGYIPCNYVHSYGLQLSSPYVNYKLVHSACLMLTWIFDGIKRVRSSRLVPLVCSSGYDVTARSVEDPVRSLRAGRGPERDSG